MEKVRLMQKLQQFSVEELHEKLNNTRKSLFSLRVNAVSTPVKDYSQYKKLRKQAARILTAINGKIKSSDK